MDSTAGLPAPCFHGFLLHGIRMDFWQVFPAAIALVFVFEGLLPFLSPRRWRAMIATIATLDDGSIRRFGLGSMLFGIVLLYLVN